MALTAQVTVMNSLEHTATLHLSDGRMQVFKMRPDIDIMKVKVVAECYIRTTNVLAVLTEKF